MIRENETVRDETITATDPRTSDRLSSETCVERAAEQRPIGSLIKELRDETTALIRQEVALAKTEMSEKASRVGRNAGYIGAGGVLAHAGAIVLLLGLSALLYAGLVEVGLSHMISGWLAPLIMGAVVAIIGYAMAQKGISTLKRESPIPERTMDSLKEDKRWLQHKATV